MLKDGFQSEKSKKWSIARFYLARKYCELTNIHHRPKLKLLKMN